MRDGADGERRGERGDLAGEGEEAEELGDLVGRAHAREHRAARRLDRARGEADQNGEGEIDLLAGRGERRAPGQLRRDGNDEQHVVAIDRQHADRGGDEQAERRDDHPFRASGVVEQAAEHRAERAGDDEDDAEQAELLAPQPNTVAA